MSFNHEADSLDDLLHATYEHLLGSGRPVVNRKGKSRETIGATLTLLQPRNRFSRSESRYIYVTPLAELCWYLSGSDRADGITPYIADYSKYTEDDGTIHGAYGPRIFGEGCNAQVRNAIARLRVNESSRRIVIQFFDKSDTHEVEHKDVPCTTTMQFLVRDAQLHAIVSMRSNDAWMGLVHDVFAFTMIQEMVARDLRVDLGTYTHFVGSLHLYDRDVSPAEEFQSEGYQASSDPMAEMPKGSPWVGVKQLLCTEEAARAGDPSCSLPDDPYWADLGRILLAHHRRKAGDRDTASLLESEIQLQPVRDLLQRRRTRGAK